MFHLCCSCCCFPHATHSTWDAATARPRCCTSSCATMRNWTRPHTHTDGTNMSQIITSPWLHRAACERECERTNRARFRTRLIRSEAAPRRPRARPLTRTATPAPSICHRAHSARARTVSRYYPRFLCESPVCVRASEFNCYAFL